MHPHRGEHIVIKSGLHAIAGLGCTSQPVLIFRTIALFLVYQIGQLCCFLE
ncbi:Uncharacterised protein [Enterobacter hormaechei]|nr:Uncharacterised protein [Enterobacter hormaechei]